MKIAGIVLAAGSATRMGRNKLLLELGGESLVRRAVRVAGEAELDPVIVVLGHEAERVRLTLEGLRCEIVVNPRFPLGMSTSLDAGVAGLPPTAAAAVVLLADMPLVDAAMIRAVVLRHRDAGARVVSSRYGAVPAPPILYARVVFPELRGGLGEGRGREVVRRHARVADFVDWPASSLADVDLTEDLERARARLGEEAR